jgi:hypothetical protein
MGLFLMFAKYGAVFVGVDVICITPL